jgi:hypothetical protein
MAATRLRSCLASMRRKIGIALFLGCRSSNAWDTRPPRRDEMPSQSLLQLRRSPAASVANSSGFLLEAFSNVCLLIRDDDCPVRQSHGWPEPILRATVKIPVGQEFPARRPQVESGAQRLDPLLVNSSLDRFRQTLAFHAR